MIILANFTNKLAAERNLEIIEPTKLTRLNKRRFSKNLFLIVNREESRSIPWTYVLKK